MKRILITLVVGLAMALTVTGIASAATSISGAVTVNGYRQPGIDIHVYRAAQGGPWVKVTSGPNARTDAQGRYFVDGLSNWFHYIVLAHGVFGKCYIGVPVQIWQGWSQQFWATGGPRGANIALTHVNTIVC